MVKPALNPANENVATPAIPVLADRIPYRELYNGGTKVFVQQPAARIEDLARFRQISPYILGSELVTPSYQEIYAFGQMTTYR